MKQKNSILTWIGKNPSLPFIVNIDSSLKISNSIFNNDEFQVEFESNDNPRFEFFHNKKNVFLPKKYSLNNSLYKFIIEKFNDKIFPKVITYHEFGHAAQTACINNNQPVHIKGTSNEGDVNYLFHGSAVPNKINNFLIKLFQEGFADCYSGLCLYKETGDIDVFKKISDVRSKRYDEIKLEKGKNFIHPNFNITAAENMGNTVKTFIENGKDIFNLPFTNANPSIERYIERCVIAGCVNSLIIELKTNDAFLNHFRKFTKEFKVEDSKINNVINSSSNLNQIIEFEKQQGISSFFFELKKRLPNTYKSIISTDILKDLLTNDIFKRNVDKNLILNNVVDIPYDSGFEKTMSNIKSIRKSFSLVNQNIENSHLKIK